MIIIPEDVLRIAEALSASIDELGLSVRSYNGLRRWGITTVADVYRAYENKQLPRIRNLGEKSVIEIEKHLEEHLAKVAPANTSEIPNSSDTISRQAALDALNNIEIPRNASWYQYYQQALTAVDKLPPAQPERIKGRWISADAIFGGEPFYCSECGENTRDTVMGKPRWNFCPNCDADMKGDIKNE